MNDDRKDQGRHQPGPWQANFARLPPRKSTVHSYAITPSAAELERGRKLRLLEDGREVGGGNFPIPLPAALWVAWNLWTALG